jgi:23S rRNA pseudouridine1911/1915/1917 synthase
MVISLEPENRIFRVAEPAIRLDRYLAKQWSDLSRSRLQTLIEEGYILVNGRGAKASQRLNIGDEIHVSLPPPQPVSLSAEPVPVSIVYEDGDVIVVDKPPGLAVHPAPGHTSQTLVNALLAHCPDLASFGDATRPGVVHRLDKDTSGLIIVAKNSFAQQHLINQFKARLIAKGYLVLVRGKLTPARGVIEAPVGRDPSNRKRMGVVSGGKQARTSYRVKEYIGDCTLLEVTTETGRTHQIRVHLAAIGCPVIGDPVYGVKSAYLKRQFVHAYRLGFRLPASGEYREFTCQLPSDLKLALELMRAS